ncbi:hypothetical protein Dsin_018612 [Dipteronia sinensis]|uniref:Reverse transcriptase domain-containing protein n=1 Tax=Dipteronia sinensis TaxID=43782 RepID=A0AAE0E285_9ROSI|nr:hypothetical protein Dsin_018612 [Dipteronia sinensis]
MGDSSNLKIGKNVEILVEYQWKPKICTECKSFGHSITNCPKLKPLLSPSENVSAPKLKQEWRRVNKRDAPLVCSSQISMKPPPFGSLKDDEVISTCNTENKPSLCPTSMPNHDQCQDLSMERVVDTSNKFAALVEDGDYCNDQFKGLSSHTKSSSKKKKKKWTAKKGKVNSSQAKITEGSLAKYVFKLAWFSLDCACFLTDRAYFLPLVERCWREQVHGTMQYKLCSKLRNLKKVLKTLNNDKAGDRNSSYFFKAINGKRNRSKIHTITGDDGSLTEGDILVKKEAIRHFQTILGYPRPVSHGIGSTLSNIIDKVISNGQADFMGRDVTDDVIREVCFSLQPNKAPGRDGFNFHFFKITWDIVGEDVISAVQEFFRSGLLLKKLNATILALVSKVPNPSKMKDFRPISCCNTLYKIIAKIIANRIKPCLPDIISHFQSDFVAGRCIGDNILLVKELMRNSHKGASFPKLALKVDLMKAFDMVDWGFLLETLATFHFPHKVIIWIKACLTTPKFSISVKGELAGFFS